MHVVPRGTRRRRRTLDRGDRARADKAYGERGITVDEDVRRAVTQITLSPPGGLNPARFQTLTGIA